MKKTNGKLIRFWGTLLLIITFALVACRNSNAPTGSLEITNQARTVTPITTEDPTHTYFPTIDHPQISTKTITLTPNKTKTPMYTKTQIPTNIPIETLTSAQAEDLVLELLETNGDCELPCMWGFIIPGKTSWKEAETFLSSFVSELITINEQSSFGLYSARFIVPEAIARGGLLYVGLETKREKFGIDSEISIIHRITFPINFPMSKFLTDYGIPNESYFKVDEPNFGIVPFEIIFFYPDKNFYVFFTGNYLFGENDPVPKYYNICQPLINDNLAYIEAWSEKNRLDIDEVFSYYDFNEGNFKPLEDLIKPNVEIFFEDLVDPSIDGCIKIESGY